MENNQSLFPQFLYGGDYNPEQWPEEIWEEDIRLMQEAGVNMVSVGVFSWSKLEPAPGEYDFGWMDRIMDMLAGAGIRVNLATPTASPPPWMTRRYPDMLLQKGDGTHLWHGSRRHYCPHSPDYQHHVSNLVTTLASHYKEHPALAMWHIDNEYGCHQEQCFCDTSAATFRVWLKAKYKDLDTLNRTWGTTFWSQGYSDWEEIIPPRSTPAFHNPSHLLDWDRFSSDSWIERFDDQMKILKEITPHIPVTTNYMGFHKGIDYWKFAAREDIVSNDLYPDTFQEDWIVEAAMVHDLIRSLGHGNPWILMEQSAAHVNWRRRNAPKKPGVMRLGSYQAIARGAVGIMFFQWRASLFGSEKFHGAMLPHAGTDTRTWQEVKSLGNELPALNQLLLSRVIADTAIMMDWESWWALENNSKHVNDIQLIPQIKNLYKAFYDRNIQVDFVHPDGNLEKYRLVVLPYQYILSKEAAKRLDDFVKGGGTILVTTFSGLADENDHIIPGGYPGYLKDVLGLKVTDFTALSESRGNVVMTSEGQVFNCTYMADIVELTSAESLAAYNKDFIIDTPAITVNHYGSGTSFYLGTELDPSGLDWLIERALKTADLALPIKGLPSGVEGVIRQTVHKKWLFLLNTGEEPVSVPLQISGVELLSKTRIQDQIRLSPYGVAVIEMN
ncbi:MAG: beta-galactosidase [Anaerolineales bacterium]|nr:beta-galactosidase [Anaerolineales bacterium]